MEVVQVEAMNKYYTLRQAAGLLGWIKASGKKVHALCDISFSVKQGEAVSVLGPNGAGKTTLVKTLSGVLLPSSGRVTCLGMDPGKSRREYTQRIGVLLGQKSGLIFDLPMMQSFAFLKAVYGLSTAEFKKQMTMLVELLEIDQLVNVPVRKLSLGQRMRAEMVAALLHSPELLFLDEPTIGLDLMIRDKIHTMLREIRKQRDLTIILTTHNPRDVEEVTERAIVIDKGRIGYDGPVEGLRVLSDSRTIAFKLLDQDKQDDIQRQFGDSVILSPAGEQLSGKITVPSNELNRALAELLQHGQCVDGVSVASPSLEEGIKQFYQRHEGGVSTS